MIERTTHYG